MHIVHIAAGAGGMYCGACARDVELVSGLRELGHEVQVIPLYTPLRFDRLAPLATERIFFGGINVFLQQFSAFFRHTPALFDRLLDNPRLLRWLSRFSIETRPEKLGPMTASMLAGQRGRQQKEFVKLDDFIEHLPRPDVISLTNSLLSGLAPELKARLGVPIACSLQGEDAFLAATPEPFHTRALDDLRENARAIDRFIAPGEAYAAQMATLLQVPRKRVCVVRAGVDVETYTPADARQRQPFTIGFLSSITPNKGLDLLAAAFCRLANAEGRELSLRIAGRVLNAEYWETVQRTIADAGLSARTEYIGEVGLTGKVQFLRGSSVFCVPSRIGESRGQAVMEALACGVPVVAPESGIFPEMFEHTGGGLLVPPEDPAALAAALARLQDDPTLADTLGRAAAAGIRREYSSTQMVKQMLAVYEGMINSVFCE